MQIAIGLYPELTALDFIGPYQVFTQVPGADVVLVAAERRHASSTTTACSASTSSTPSPTSRAPTSSSSPAGSSPGGIVRDGHPIVDWVARRPPPHHVDDVGVHRRADARRRRGARRSAGHDPLDRLRRPALATAPSPTEQRVVIEGKVATAAGVSAGIDLALTLVGEWYGRDIAEAVQLGIEYDPQPPYDSGAPSKARPEVKQLVQSVQTEAEAGLLA